MKLLSVPALVMALAFSFSVKQKTIQVTLNKNLELFGLMMQLDLGPDLASSTDSVIIENKKSTWRDWYLLAWKNYQRYKAFDSCAMMHLYRQQLAKGFYNDFFVGFLEQVDEVPFARLRKDTDTGFIIPFSSKGDINEARQNADAFLHAFNEFYLQIHFDKHLDENKQYYNQVIRDVKKYLPDASFIPAMESFYNKSFNTYYLIPVLNIPTSMGFGKLNKITGTIYNAFGPFSFQSFDPQRLQLGFDFPDRIRELSVHEFGHSFVNPAIDKLPTGLVKGTEYLYLPIKEEMSKKAYTSWTICLYEHFVRAGEVIIARKGGHPDEAEKILKDNAKGKFVYLAFIVKELTVFDKNPDPNKSYDEFVVTALRHLQETYK
jgi:hypothetical protein